MIIDHDNLEDFADPANYDLEETGPSAARVAFYRALALECGGPVLELACGSGIVALPVAAARLAVTGVDLCGPMLAHAAAKARTAGLAIDWRHGDMRDIRLGARFRFVYLTGNAFQAMLSDADQAALLATVRAHLAEGGTFAFETRHPPAHDLADIDAQEHWFGYTNVDGHEVSVGGTQRWDARAQVLHWTTVRRWRDADDVRRTRTSRVACRYTEAEELDARLAEAGFAVAARYGDWDRSPLGPRSAHIVSVCRVAGA